MKSVIFLLAILAECLATKQAHLVSAVRDPSEGHKNVLKKQTCKNYIALRVSADVALRVTCCRRWLVACATSVW